MTGFDACVFCGASPTNNEDVVPRWLVRFLRLVPPATRRIGRTFADRTDLGGASAQSVEGIGVGKVKAVCGDNCNNGWMKRLEDQTKPILQELILKCDSVTLDQDAQETLAVWALKTATMLMVLYSKVPSATLLTPLRDLKPPEAAIVWMARVEPEIVRVGGGPLLATAKDDPSIRSEGYIARLTFGNVGFVVFGNPAPRGGTWMMSQDVRDRFNPIWPAREPVLEWPITATVTANHLDRFAEAIRGIVTRGQPLPAAPDHHVFTFDEDEMKEGSQAAGRPQTASE